MILMMVLTILMLLFIGSGLNLSAKKRKEAKLQIKGGLT